MTIQASPEISLCFCRSMRRVSNRLVKLYSAALAPCGLKVVELALLADIQRKTAPTLPELADAFHFDRYSLRYKLSPLEKAQLIEVTPDGRDSRSRRVTLTAKGRDKLDEAMPLWREAQTWVETSMGAAEAAKFRSDANLLSMAAFAAPI